MRAIILISAIVWGSIVNAQVIKKTLTPKQVKALAEKVDYMVKNKAVLDTIITLGTKQYSRALYLKYRNDIGNMSLDTLKARFIREINAYRKSKNLGPLTSINELDSAAMFIAKYNVTYYAKNNKLNHTTNIPGYEELSQRLNIFLKDKPLNNPSQHAENLLMQGSLYPECYMVINNIPTYEKEILDIWKKSPGHNRNMLLPKAKYIGFAVVGDIYSIVIY